MNNFEPRHLREMIVVDVYSTANDRIFIQLVETGTDTGEFCGYAFTDPETSEPDDSTLYVQPNEELRAKYQDRYDKEEVSETIALVDPNGRIFDSTTGDLLNGIQVSVVHADTGAPAEVYGHDGLSRYPSQLITGELIVDESGREYNLTDGEFLFPLMAPGHYRLELEPPPGYTVPSLATNFDGLENSPFVINGASYSLAFELDGTGVVTFDVPMDPASEVILEKTAGVTTAAIGDFVPCTLKVTNAEPTGSRLVIRDTPARGLKLIRSSIHIDGRSATDDEIRLTGNYFEVRPAVIPSGQTVTIDYVMEVAAGTKNGLNRNTAIAHNGLGLAMSNTADVSILVYEDLLRSTSTITGRVVEESCGPLPDPDAEQTGIPGVRIYLETGEYVVTDENGFYHFEQVEPGTHVVRLDDGVLPPGVQPLSCGDGKAKNAQFVDLMGGVVGQSNFSLERSVDVEEMVAVQGFNESIEHKKYGQAWLDTQAPATRWVYPDPSRTPSTGSINIGIQHSPDAHIELRLNGKALSSGNFSGMLVSTNGETAISKWRSVDIQDGQNTLVAVMLDANGHETGRLTEDIWYIEEVTRARVLEENSQLVADGQSNPVIAVRFTDDGGRPVHSGRIMSVNVEPPYKLDTSGDIAGDIGISRSLADDGGVAVGNDGIAEVCLEPTLETGMVTLRVELDNGRVERLRAYLKPVPRPWIVVGLAEIGLGEGAPGADGLSGDGDTENTGNAPDEIDPFVDGRLALYAKGEVGNGWQATIAVDTKKRRGDFDQGFNREIDPSASYNLFGDNSYQQQDAASRYPVYAKLEKDKFQAMFGDYNTDLQETELARYSRELSGLKIVQEKDTYGISLFAAETNQGFNSDELAADGTSGPYQLSVAPILGQSETVTIETRDRLRPDRILDQRVLQRYLDYDLDYRTGLLVFRAPLDATDNAFNPNLIVVDYETSEDSERHITAGGRATTRLRDGDIELGATLVHEGGNTGNASQKSDLIALDMTVSVSDRTEIRAEYA